MNKRTQERLAKNEKMRPKVAVRDEIGWLEELKPQEPTFYIDGEKP